MTNSIERDEIKSTNKGGGNFSTESMPSEEAIENVAARNIRRVAGGAIDGLDRIGDYIKEVGRRQREFDERSRINPRFMRRKIGF